MKANPVRYALSTMDNGAPLLGAEVTRAARRRQIVVGDIDQTAKPELQILQARPTMVVAGNRLLPPIDLHLLADTLGHLVGELGQPLHQGRRDSGHVRIQRAAR